MKSYRNRFPYILLVCLVAPFLAHGQKETILLRNINAIPAILAQKSPSLPAFLQQLGPQFTHHLNETGRYAVVNIDDDMSCYDARVRFGLVLNNESNINTLNDAAGFGASAYYSSSCDYSDAQDAPWSVGAGFAAGSNLYQRAGTIWVR